MITKLKSALFEEIRKHHGGDIAALSDEELNKAIFHKQDTLRLTLSGFIQVKAIFTAYSFQLPPNIKSRHRQALSTLKYPYFLTSKRLVLFSDMDAMMVKLQGGVESFLEGCYQLDR